MRFKKGVSILSVLFLSVSASFAASHGYFIANTIKSAGTLSDRNFIYDKLAIVSYENQKYINDIWVQTGYRNFSLASDGNSKGGFNSDTGVLSFGYGKEIIKDATLGFFGKYNNQSISQGKSSADVSSYGIGAYGGYIYKEFDFKGILSFSGHQLSSSRYDAAVANKARSDFNGYGISIDLEASMWLELSDMVNLRPYAGLDLIYTGYGNSKEIGAGSGNLKTDNGSFTKSSMRAGAGVNGKYEKFGWYGGLELELMLAGKSAEIESGTGAGFNTKVTSEGAESGIALIGLNAGGDYDITNQLKAYAKLDYKLTDGLNDFYGSLGLAFSFNSF